MSEEHAQIKTDNGMPPVQPEDAGFRVYIGNLPFDATEEKVREFVAPVGGEILNVHLPLKFGKRPSGYAFVGYEAEESAKKAVEQLNDKSFGERTVTLQLARSKEETAERRKASDERRAAAKATRALEKKQKTIAERQQVIVEGGDIGEDAPKAKSKKSAGRRRTAAEGEDEVAEGADGEAASKPKRKPRNRKPKSQEARIDGDAEGAAPAEGEEKPKKEKKARKPRQPKLELTGEASKNTIFVGNLPFSVDDEALAEVFTNLSIKVKSAKVVMGVRRVRDETRPFRGSRGFGFVEVEDPAQQQEAVDKVAGTLIGDRTISAKIANEMRPVEKEAVEAVADVSQATQ